MALNTLLEQVKSAVIQHTEQQNAQPGPFDPTGLLTTLENLFTQHQTTQNEPQGMDPYGGLPDETGNLRHNDVHSTPKD